MLSPAEMCIWGRSKLPPQSAMLQVSATLEQMIWVPLKCVSCQRCPFSQKLLQSELIMLPFTGGKLRAGLLVAEHINASGATVEIGRLMTRRGTVAQGHREGAPTGSLMITAAYTEGAVTFSSGRQSFQTHATTVRSACNHVL